MYKVLFLQPKYMSLYPVKKQEVYLGTDYIEACRVYERYRKRYGIVGLFIHHTLDMWHTTQERKD